VVTYSGSSSTQNIAHTLGSVPGCIIVKKISGSGGWVVYHRSLGASAYIVLNSTSEAETGQSTWNNTSPTSTQFTVLGDNASVNEAGSTYVAYLFAHDAGGFGLTGTDNVISCGSFTGDGSGNATVNLGYEPQWVLWKRTNATGDWGIIDNMRGMTVDQNNPYLRPNTTNGDSSIANFISPNATGFTATGFGAGSVNIYVAIRRGPMRTPTTGTSVFAPVTYAGNSSSSTTTTNTLTNGFAADAAFVKARNDAGPNWGLTDKLRGRFVYLEPNAVNAESTLTSSQNILFNNTQSVLTGFASADFSFNFSSVNYIQYAFQRAPGFFDEVCYTGSGSARTLNHNLGVVPELMIVKDRSSTSGWSVYAQPLGATNAMVLQTTAAVDTGTSRWNSTTPTSTVFSLGNSGFVNSNTRTYVAYLFASLPGISKVGSYTGNATTQTINCGFTAGCRFILIKRTDDLGSWHVWDSARGIVSGNDPYLLVNSSAAEVTSTDWVDTVASGFELTNTAPAALNALGGNYIFLAIA
jgi:hypothetical protein